ncbi:LOW QUALITY PROTEIN: zinc finger CCCH domain-containing protein 29-like [Salvia hispanica]|uniref:LOW QUALITY PROTEIN: zinc finger CCCH domain-containing protein 29-like n=1 Tax=Salvia hispanica TaxID=49212 RepID=UPI0020096E8E|nr:LOW QUALITY PROTEIN: zinc finger CCCH domain-containing protein 29-like [Salvia hispanica]
MCSDLKNKHGSSDLEMEAVGRLNNCSKLLEFAATDDLDGFVHEVEQRGRDVDEVSLWYGRSFGSKKMGYEERTPIMIAALYGNTEVLRYIIATGIVDVNRACGLDGATALHCAAAGGSWSSAEVVELLMAASADTSIVDVSGRKPGDLIAPCVRSSASPRRRQLEMMLNGVTSEGEEEGSKKQALATSENREYPIDIPLPDINTGVYGSDEFRMYSFKVKPCSRAYSHDWTECPFVHPGENARRRDPRTYHYTCVPATRMADLTPTNLDDIFGSLDPSMLSQLQGLSPKINNTTSSQMQSPTGLQMRQNMNQLRASYPMNVSSSPSRNPSPYGFDSSAAVAAAVMNSRSAAFTKRSQSFIDRSGGNGYRYGPTPNSPAGLVPQKHSEWGAPDGKLEWGFNGEEVNKLRKSASFGFRTGANAAPAHSDVGEPDVSWVNTLVKDVPAGAAGMYSPTRRQGMYSPQQRQGGHETTTTTAMIPQWLEQMYIEQEQIVA